MDGVEYWMENDYLRPFQKLVNSDKDDDKFTKIKIPLRRDPDEENKNQDLDLDEEEIDELLRALDGKEKDKSLLKEEEDSYADSLLKTLEEEIPAPPTAPCMPRDGEGAVPSVEGLVTNKDHLFSRHDGLSSYYRKLDRSSRSEHRDKSPKVPQLRMRSPPRSYNTSPDSGRLVRLSTNIIKSPIGAHELRRETPPKKLKQLKSPRCFRK